MCITQSNKSHRYSCLIIEYSSFSIFLLYLIGVGLFCIDILLAVYRAEFNVIITEINNDSTTTTTKINCILLNDEFDIRITKALIELSAVCLVYFLLFISLIFYEWFRSSHWEYQIRLDSDNRLSELFNFVYENYPRSPQDVDNDAVNPHKCCYKPLLPSRHWLFQSDAKRAPKSEFPRLTMMWLCTLIQIGIFCFARCFSTGQISYSNFELIAYVYAIFNLILSIISWFATLMSSVAAWCLTRFYSFFGQQIFTFLTINHRPSNVNSFLTSIGKDGMAYLIRIGDVCGTSKMQYLLMMMFYEFCRCNDIQIPLNDSWNHFENSYFEYISTGKKADSSLVESLLNASTYEHFDNVECENVKIVSP